MPLDVFAALGALVRAEAVRTKRVPAPTPADQSAPQQPGGPAPTPDEQPTAVTATPSSSPSPSPPSSPSPARRGLLARMVHRLTTLFGQGGRTPAHGPGAGGQRPPE
ncbi:hypothetical protein ACGFWI_04645 [Streptomyces sp. NPDC048434]|uniref:hypothetical protein n=1 Tax=Streptomyces sp. NPDC048434 TaxID=3365549 RepID=UPI0037196FC5